MILAVPDKAIKQYEQYKQVFAIYGPEGCGFDLCWARQLKPVLQGFEVPAFYVVWLRKTNPGKASKEYRHIGDWINEDGPVKILESVLAKQIRR